MAILVNFMIVIYLERFVISTAKNPLAYNLSVIISHLLLSLVFLSLADSTDLRISLMVLDFGWPQAAC